ncbi:hypothetical protein [uncultured Methanobrevibacter sp.]|uniref:hypothetical protein n=2 Tax=uncultured Methanobrevibacter sp. TaxID=253161 RepID=UPI0025EB1BBA|nr:hypothetical protein [uncultured Methanobrevibacter sp.]
MKFKRIFLITLLLLSVITISSVCATDDNATDEVINIENLQNSDGSADNVNLNDEFSEITSNNANDEILGLNEQSSEITLCENESNILTSKDNCMLGDSGSHSMKITIKPAKVYSHTKFSYSAKLTDNDKPISGVLLDLSIEDASNGWTCYSARTNSNGVATFKLDPEKPGKFNIEVELEDYDAGYAYAYSYIKVIKNPKAKTYVKAPKITANYKQKKYFKITVKNYKRKPIKKLRLTLYIQMGKKWKLYHLKTNSKGVANFNVKKLKPGTHDVFIYIEEVHSKYDLEKNSKIIIKKAASKKKTTTKKSKYKIISITAKKHFKTKKSGKFKVKSVIFDMWRPYYGDYKYIDTWLCKNGKLVEQTKYKTKYYVNGKWTKWMTFKWGTNHHRYPVYDDTLSSIKIKVKVRR